MSFLIPIIGAAAGSALATAGYIGISATLAAQIGWVAGTLISAYFFTDTQTFQQEGPRLGDLSTQKSEYGKPIPRIYGTYRAAGNVIWSLDLHEEAHVEEYGGKGGGNTTEETTYTYSGSWAVAFCEGPIESVGRIWFDSVLEKDSEGTYGVALTAGNHTVYLGTEDQPGDWYIASDQPDTPAYRNVAYIVFNHIELENWGNRIPNVSVEIIQDSECTVKKVIDGVLIRAGVDEDNINTTVATETINGYAITKPTSTIAAINPIIMAYLYDLAEYDFKLNMVKREGEPDYTITANDVVETHLVKRKQEGMLPKSVLIQYSNPELSFDPGVQSSSKIDANTELIGNYQLPLVLYDDYAKQLSEKLLYIFWTQQTEHEFVLTSDFIDLKPADIVFIQQYWELDGQEVGYTHVVRITDITYTTEYSLECKASTEYAGMYESNAIGSSTSAGLKADTIDVQGPNTFEILDIPMINSSNNTEGVWIVGQGYNDTWDYAKVYKTTDGGQTIEHIGKFSAGESRLGTVTTALAEGRYNIIDTTSSTTVTLEYGELFSSTIDEVLADPLLNIALVGSEIIQFVNATDNGSNSYTLDTFLRGRRGTEWSLDTHVIGERFVLLDTQGMLFDRGAQLNVTNEYFAVSKWDTSDGTMTDSITPSQIRLKPYTPMDIRASRDVSNNLTIEFVSRGRDTLSGQTSLLPGLTVYDNTYEIDILLSSVVVRTLTGTKVSLAHRAVIQAEYSAADQTTDGYTPGDPVDIEVFQISAVAGRGYKAQETV